MDTENIGDRTLEAYQRGPDAVIAFVGELVAELAERVIALEEEKAPRRVGGLATNSRNSGKPPSSDDPDEVKVHAPSHCAGCCESLAEVPAVCQERRQVVDLPVIHPIVVEHRAETKCCPGCGTKTSGAFPQDVKGPVQHGPGAGVVAVYPNQAQLLPLERTCEVLGEVFDCPIAEVTLESAVGRCHEQLAETEAVIKRGVEEAKAAGRWDAAPRKAEHFDETGLNVDGRSFWLHVASTPSLTFYAVHKKRGREAMEEIGVLPDFLGRAVHDGLPSYWQYGQCAHALCNAHHLQELIFVEEQLGQPWAKKLKGLLLEIKQGVDDAPRRRGAVNGPRGQGQERLPAEMKREFAARYDALLELGFKVASGDCRNRRGGQDGRSWARRGTC